MNNWKICIFVYSTFIGYNYNNLQFLNMQCVQSATGQFVSAICLRTRPI